MLFYQEKLLLIFFLYIIGGTIALELITSSEYVSLFVLENNFYNVEIVDYH